MRKIINYLRWRRHLSRILNSKRRFVVRSRPEDDRQIVCDRWQKDIITFYTEDAMDRYTVREIFDQNSYSFCESKTLKKIMSYYNCRSKSRKQLIVDCGSNIGASSVFFSRAFKDSLIVAIEPNSRNAKLHRLNCSEKNVRFLHAAIGPSCGEINFVETRNPRTSFVTQGADGDAKIEMVSVAKIIEDQEYEPFMIKIDIEGFEKELFEKNVGWVDKFPIIIVEPHDWMLHRGPVIMNFLKEISKRKRYFFIKGENIISVDEGVFGAEGEAVQ